MLQVVAALVAVSADLIVETGKNLIPLIVLKREETAFLSKNVMVNAWRWTIVCCFNVGCPQAMEFAGFMMRLTPMVQMGAQIKDGNVALSSVHQVYRSF